LDSARERFEDAAEDLDRRYRRTARDVRRGVKDVADSARERYEDATQNVKRGYVKARREAERIGNDVNDYVKENPGKSILIAAGVGFLLGLLIGRNRDND
jgi:ElaB/YqjD/DUF883 family membrane-anchored ribosome-binding protein